LNNLKYNKWVIGAIISDKMKAKCKLGRIGLVYIKSIRFFIFLTVLINLNLSLSTAQPLQTEILNTENGLSNNMVLCIFQDSYELLWIGTEYGLNLYDGYRFKKFINDPGDPESINSNVIWCVVEDAENNLWIATGAGVSKYLRHENKFSLLKMNIIRLLLTDQEIFG
jgi:hypothetical protein